MSFISAKFRRGIALVVYFATMIILHQIVCKFRCSVQGGLRPRMYIMQGVTTPVDESGAVAESINRVERSLQRTVREWTDGKDPGNDNVALEYYSDSYGIDDDNYHYWDDHDGSNAEDGISSKAETVRQVDGAVGKNGDAKGDPGALSRAKLNDVSLGREKFTDTIKGDKEEYFKKIEEYQPRIDPHTYRYNINPKDACLRTEQDPSEIFLLIFVNTAPGNFLKRVYMRSTFGRRNAWPLTANESMRIVFSIGATNDQNVQAQIYLESEMYGDIIQEDFVDHYWNMTLKSVMGIKWTTLFCRRAIFTMKTDDDVLLNTPLIYKFLKESPQVNFTLGDVLKDLGPVRDKDSLYAKFYTPKHVFEYDEYPPFYGGSSYIMSTDVVEKTYYMALKTHLIPWSDVFIGICFYKVGLTPGNRHLFRQNARFHIQNDFEEFQMDDERLTYLKQHMSFYHLTITQSKTLWDIWTEGMCKLQCTNELPPKQ